MQSVTVTFNPLQGASQRDCQLDQTGMISED